jgi:hypothetical protein
MNNEPVAWMDYLEHSDVYDLNVSGRGIPLYTHPAKTLTDEEIIEVWDKMCSIVLDNDKNITEFARAILRKAQEK